MCISLPLLIQALEVYLGNVIPPDQKDWPVESAVVLEELVANQVIVWLVSWLYKLFLEITDDFLNPYFIMF